MSKKFVQKNIKLSLELDRYLSKHPKALNKIPRGSYIVITKNGDAKFNAESKQLVGGNKKCIVANKAGSGWTIKPLSE